MTKKRVRFKPKIPQLEAKLRRAEEIIETISAENRRLARLLKHGDELRKVGEHWYELLEYFDPHKIHPVPLATGGRVAHAMGVLSEAIVIEIPDGTTPEDLSDFTKTLRERGIGAPFLFVTRGVRFLRLGTVTAELEAELDAKERRHAAEDPCDLGVPRLEPAGPGPEPAGHGLGGAEPADVEGAGDGGGRHQAPDEAG